MEKGSKRQTLKLILEGKLHPKNAGNLPMQSQYAHLSDEELHEAINSYYRGFTTWGECRESSIELWESSIGEIGRFVRIAGIGNGEEESLGATEVKDLPSYLEYEKRKFESLTKGPL